MTKEKINRVERITREIELPNGVVALIEQGFLLIKGTEGEVKRDLRQRGTLIKTDGQKIVFESVNGTKKNKKMINSLIAHVKNMIKGSLQNHVYTLKICSGHFPMNVSVANTKLIIKNFFGEKVPRVLQLKNSVDVKVEGDLIYVTSANKEIAGQVSADIEQLTRRPGYDTRIFQDGIYITNKDGKEMK